MMRLTGLVLLLILGVSAAAQENSPYSRFGLGDMVPSQNIISRAMGGISAGYADFRSVNYVNPASYSALQLTTFDFGAEIDRRKLKSTTTGSSFSSTNLIISYLQLGVPVRMNKLNKKGIYLGMNFGLRPVSRINYKILNARRTEVDSLGSLYKGDGGLNDALFGVGLKIKNLSIGFNGAYRFGNKNYDTSFSVLNDSVFHYPSTIDNKSNFHGMAYTLGLQYDIKVKKKGILRLGAYTNLQSTLKGNQDYTIQTVQYDAEGAVYRVDSVYTKTGSGNVIYPSGWGAGFTYQDSVGHWMFGADYEKTNWNEYRFFGSPDKLKDTWKVRAGIEYLPASYNTPVKKYFSFVKYRFGFYYGPDRINLGSDLPEYGFSFGAGFPLKLRSSFYETQTSYLNTAIEIGSRGNKNNNLRESLFRISFGFTLSDRWFVRSKYY